eukprot:CAMPEP_0115835306 /NCGR_PEP_ID=MMETSP0287-20121206/4126_1 /TAXON_ID=412157 /ORGANISM="Chrysochromulina rotalis, Strain UIO044" /LENGTH=53 /DNA_ID=CAMNT_0003288759 /DNA_START=613 /DNA_END=774 /DNA_ORIENTATION=-
MSPTSRSRIALVRLPESVTRASAGKQLSSLPSSLPVLGDGNGSGGGGGDGWVT